MMNDYKMRNNEQPTNNNQDMKMEMNLLRKELEDKNEIISNFTQKQDSNNLSFIENINTQTLDELIINQQLSYQSAQDSKEEKQEYEELHPQSSIDGETTKVCVYICTFNVSIFHFVD